MSTLMQTLMDKLRSNLNMAESETFSDVPKMNLALVVVIVVAIELLLLVLGKFLYNQVLCKTITALKPLPTIWHFLGLQVILIMLRLTCGLSM